jgi:ribose/xylose/arabinose/galactoside ABC-type transport system permease subunit
MTITKITDNKFLKQFSESWILILVIVVLGSIIGIIAPVFFSITNLINIIISISVICIVGVGMTMVILLAGIDVSVGGILALSTVIVGNLFHHTSLPPFLVVVIGLVVGLSVGAFNGFFTAFLKIPALIVTLATLSITRGLVLVITKAKTTYEFPESFLVLGQGFLFKVPAVVYVTTAGT